MKLIVLMTEAIEKGLEVADSWQAAGAPGVTILRGVGLHSLKQSVKQGQIELPRMLISMADALAEVLEQANQNVLVFLCACYDEQVDDLIAKTNAVLGDLTQPGHGVLLVVPLDKAIGIRALS